MNLGWESLSDGTTRLTNIIVAALGAVVALPLMLCVAIAIATTSRGPVLYHQPRVGRDRRLAPNPRTEGERRTFDLGGRIFTIYKFRSMSCSGRETLPEAWARADDPRITPVGFVLRKHRLDELPQFFNVLRGDMNVVGPRPEQPRLFQEMRAEVDGYADRQTVLPGITGWAQINHPYDRHIADVKRKVELDIEYIRHRSPTKDLMIMARTVPVMIRRRGSP